MSNEHENVSSDELERSRQWFERYVRRLANTSVVKSTRKGQRYRCPCCLFPTLRERGGFEICKVCFWEDDGQDEQDADTVRGGPNAALSLSDARRNFALFGACEERFKGKVRPPNSREISSDDDFGA